MPIPRIHADRAALLVIDLQERLMPTIVDQQKITTNASILLRMAELMEIPYLVTEQYPAGLGRTVEIVAGAMSDRSRRVEKTRFSALVDVVDERLAGWRRSDIIVGGIEAHVCVLQTVLDLQASGRQCFLCSDAISSSQRDQVEPAYERMAAAGAVRTGVMSVMYELLADARHPRFRDCLELAKSVEQ